MATAVATERELKLAVDFGGVSIGDATASIGVTVDRKDLDLATADEYFSGKRLEGEIRISNGSENQPKLFDSGEEIPRIATVFDVKRFGINSKAVSLRLTFSLDSIDVGVLSHFAKRCGWLEVDNLGEIPRDEEEDAISFTAGPSGPRTLGGIDKGGSMHLRSLERSELKELLGRDPGTDNSLTPAKMQVLVSHVDIQTGGSTIAHLERIMREDAYWHTHIKGFGDTWIEKTVNALLAFRSKFPMPSDDDSEEDAEGDAFDQDGEELEGVEA